MSSKVEDSEESWVAYRKLIVESLKRLEERTTEIYNVQNKQETRLTILEDLDLKACLEDIKDSIRTLENTNNTESGGKTASNKVLDWVVKALIAIGSAIVTVVVGKYGSH